MSPRYSFLCKILEGTLRGPHAENKNSTTAGSNAKSLMSTDNWSQHRIIDTVLGNRPSVQKQTQPEDVLSGTLHCGDAGRWDTQSKQMNEVRESL